MKEDFGENTIIDNKEQRQKMGQKSASIGLLANGFLSTSKIAIGTITGAVSITADGINNLTDMLSSIVSLVSFKISEKPADKEHPFGHARIEYLASIAVGIIIFWAGISLLRESVDSILHPKEISTSIWTFVVLILSIIVKFGLYKYNTNLGKRVSSELIYATGMDARNDVIATSGVLLSMIVLLIFSINIDGFVGLLVTVVIFKSGWDILKTTMDQILGEGPDSEKVREVKEFISSFEGVLGIHDLMVHDYGPSKKFLTVHVEVNAEEDIIELHEIIDHIERELEHQYGVNATIHMDPIQVNDPKTMEVRNYIEKKLASIDKKLGFHDFRIVERYQGINVIFDILVPLEYEKTEREIIEELNRVVALEHPEYQLIVTFDLDYHNELDMEEMDGK
ncbi:cation diffusion facilitator family transporter [Peptoniphilus sp. KCTC 25270]|uniref:cation diffusion facilitator family transporter n=1 Tax=Peptoniphilus sp. KCTC 25270 TaxID=2897414 RepID=UPI001E5C6DA5|nr:cation diffusion facilitator family transporter [Peptoniphilus sp. KCTC 25270]MCD1147418.1 cation diffusion facilitator family transporter [Peptoniphilus sp. KCTC 25270]